MKVKVLTWINSVLAFLLGITGFSSCKPEAIAEKYGVPYALLEVSGTITDQAKKPLENIQVTVKRKDNNDFLGEVYSEADGRYVMESDYVFPEDSFDILVTDTAGVYESDSVRVKAEYENGSPNQHDFQLKKK